MKLHFFSIPVHGSAAAQDELNQFLGTHRVVSIERHLLADGGRSAWAVCVTIDDVVEPAVAGDASKRARIDYREVLSEAEFALFARLRDARKGWADQEGVPPYAVFTNEQLADIVRRDVKSASDLAKIQGLGGARSEKYGKRLLEVMRGARATHGGDATATAASEG